MTRINLVDPVDLTDQHLIAELREIKMVPAAFLRSKRITGDPKNFTLGSGHVKFFWNKREYLRDRFYKLMEECLNRKFDIDIEYHMSKESVFDVLHESNYIPDKLDYSIIVDRIVSRINEKPDWYRYNKLQLSESFVNNFIQKYKGK